MRKLIVFMTLIISMLTFSIGFEDEIEKQRLSIRQAIYSNLLDREKRVVADAVSADLFLEELSNSNIEIGEIQLIFPDVENVKKYIDGFSKHIAYSTEIYLLKNKSNAFKMQNRSYVELQEVMDIERLKNIPNLKVIVLDIPEKEQKNIYIDAFLEAKTLETEVYRKYIRE